MNGFSAFELSLINECIQIAEVPSIDSRVWAIEPKTRETIVKCFDQNQHVIAEFTYDTRSEEKALKQYTILNEEEGPEPGHKRVIRSVYRMNAQGLPELFLKGFYEYKDGRYVALGVISTDGTITRYKAR